LIVGVMMIPHIFLCLSKKNEKKMKKKLDNAYNIGYIKDSEVRNLLL